MSKYKLTRRAESDLIEIALFGIERFGEHQAEKYHQGLKERIKSIAQCPLSYPAVDHIVPGYRRSVFKAHSIYYRVTNEQVLIVRVLGKQSLCDAFSD